MLLAALWYFGPSFSPNFFFFADNTTIYFLKSIVSRQKSYLHNDDVKVIHVPQYKGLSIEKVLQFVSNKPRIDQYLPDHPDIEKVPKQWIVNVCAAVLGD